jgi:hypothetical protein
MKAPYIGLEAERGHDSQWVDTATATAAELVAHDKHYAENTEDYCRTDQQ